MKSETIELKVEVTGLDEAQKKISDFMNHPDVLRYEALMGGAKKYTLKELDKWTENIGAKETVESKKIKISPPGEQTRESEGLFEHFIGSGINLINPEMYKLWTLLEEVGFIKTKSPKDACKFNGKVSYDKRLPDNANIHRHPDGEAIYIRNCGVDVVINNPNQDQIRSVLKSLDMENVAFTHLSKVVIEK